MNDPGANLNGTVGLTSTTSDGGSGLATVTYEYSPAGQSSWTATPASWDTTAVGDGLYDLRVIATDVAGNSTTSAPVVDRRVDNGVPDYLDHEPDHIRQRQRRRPIHGHRAHTRHRPGGVQFFTCDNASANCSTGSWVSLGTDATAPYSVVVGSARRRRQPSASSGGHRPLLEHRPGRAQRHDRPDGAERRIGLLPRRLRHDRLADDHDCERHRHGLGPRHRLRSPPARRDFAGRRNAAARSRAPGRRSRAPTRSPPGAATAIATGSPTSPETSPPTPRGTWPRSTPRPPPHRAPPSRR